LISLLRRKLDDSVPTHVGASSFVAAATYKLTLPGPMLERGFWLYVWRVETPAGEFLYVGRTGDSSSPNATPPYQRMGQHLGHQPSQNMLRKNLEKKGIKPEVCTAFHLIAHGPLFAEAAPKVMELHKPIRDKVAALEKALAEELKTSGYEVLNTVKCKMPLDAEMFATVRTAFATHFPALQRHDLKSRRSP
jgi:hypothetical protein